MKSIRVLLGAATLIAGSFTIAGNGQSEFAFLYMLFLILWAIDDKKGE